MMDSEKEEFVPENIETAPDTEIEEMEEIEEIEDDNPISQLENEENLEIKNLEIKCGEWINTDLVPVKKIKCIIPIKLLKAIRDIEISVNKKFTSRNEFSIYIHGEYDEDGNISVSEDFYIPKQKVTCASVDYVEQPEPYYNGCLHKHPDGCTNFSGTDEKYINCNFEFSLLYVNHNIRLGIVNIKYHNNHRVQVPVTIQIDDDDIENPINIDNILKPDPPKLTEYNPTATVNTPKIANPAYGGVVLPTVVNPLTDDEDNDIDHDALTYLSQQEFDFAGGL